MDLNVTVYPRNFVNGRPSEIVLIDPEDLDKFKGYKTVTSLTYTYTNIFGTQVKSAWIPAESSVPIQLLPPGKPILAIIPVTPSLSATGLLSFWGRYGTFSQDGTKREQAT